MTRVALTLAAVLAFALCNGTAGAQEPPQVSKGTAKILKAAQEALAVKNYNEVLAKTREAMAVTPRNAYDDFVIHELQMAVFAAQSDYSQTGAAIEAISQEEARRHMYAADRARDAYAQDVVLSWHVFRLRLWIGSGRISWNRVGPGQLEPGQVMNSRACARS